ncbi:hypothetical protein B7494_g6558 [Chlorociboria aeruginascens]|nr:hypothetical protein B7494_g6558 [Chlorociboria aeruginascens]
MSTRRSTRATTRASTAYGTNTVARPNSPRGTPVADNIDNVLAGVLNPEVNRGARTRHKTPRSRATGRSVGSTDRSFRDESGLFGQAGIDPSLESSGLQGIPEVPEPECPRVRNVDHLAEKQTKDLLDAIAHEQRRRPAAPIAQPDPRTPIDWSLFWNPLSSLLNWIIFSFKKWFSYGLLILLAYIALSAFTALYSHRDNPSLSTAKPPVATNPSAGYDITDSIIHALPYVVRHPSSLWAPDDVVAVQKSIEEVERHITDLKRGVELDKQAIEKLNKDLPDYLVVEKDSYGNIQVPNDLWHALQDKIKTDSDLFRTEYIDSSGSKLSPPPTEEIERIVEQTSSRIWDGFLIKNNARIAQLAVKEIEHRFPELLKGAYEDSIITSKAEIIDLIRQNWSDSQKDVGAQMAEISKELQSQLLIIKKLQHDTVGYEDLQITVIDALRKQLSAAQIEALSRANINGHTDRSLRRINHFSQGTGAAVNPYLTSPNYLFPSMNVIKIRRFFAWAFFRPYPTPNAPEAALSKWEEHGDCWCSPINNDGDFGPSLGVIMGQSIFPDEVVIEHLPQTASLEPGATPKDMELLAFIEDVPVYEAVKSLSQQIFTGEKEALRLPTGFVRIATWTYDANALQHIQSFPVQVDLKAFATQDLPSSVQTLVVRTKNNWGGGVVEYSCLYRVRVHGDIDQTHLRMEEAI